jgi:hypothetical protein
MKIGESKGDEVEWRLTPLLLFNLEWRMLVFFFLNLKKIGEFPCVCV